MKRKYQIPQVVLAVLVIAALACGVTVEGPTPPAAPIPVSTEAAGQLTELWKNAALNSQNGQVSVVITEAQLTSFLAIKLAEQTDPPLRDPQVFLRDNKIQIYGTAKAGDVTTTAAVILTPVVTPDGVLQFTLTQAEFGPVPVPAALLENLSAILNSALTGQVGELATGIKITSAVIVDGQLAIVGVIKK